MRRGETLTGREIPFRRTPTRGVAPPLSRCALLAFGVLLVAPLGATTTHGAPARAAAITFDDLPVISVTPMDAAGRREVTARLLAALRKHHIPAVGFVNEYALYGYRTTDEGAPNPDGVALLKAWVDAHLELGNHGFAHLDYHRVDAATFRADVVRGEKVTGALLAARGARLRYFRHPYLHTGLDLDAKRSLERFLAERGYRVAPVTVQNEDWQFAAAYSRAAERHAGKPMEEIATAYVAHTAVILQRSERLSTELFGREIPQVVLLHANALNADHLEDLVRLLEERGYEFVTLDRALEDSAYRSPDRYLGDPSLDWLARWAITRGTLSVEQVLAGIPDVPPFVLEAAETPPDARGS